MGISVSGPASAAIVTSARIAGNALGGPFGGAAAAFVATGALSLFGGGQSTYEFNGQVFFSMQEYSQARLDHQLNSHKEIPSSERDRLTQGRTTRTTSFKQALPPRRRVYGTIDEGAPLLLHEVRSPYTYVGYALSDGPIAGATHVSIGGKKWGLTGTALTDTSVYSPFILHVSTGAGDDAQAVDAMAALTAGASPLEKPATYRQRGVARAFARLHYGDDPDAGGVGTGLVAHNSILWGGSTVFEYTIAGMIIDDFNGGTSYSANPANQLYDFLLCDWPGKISAGDIDLDSFAIAASDSDHSNFECHGVVYADGAAGRSIESILSTCDGSLIRPSGLYKMKVDKVSASVLTLTDSDFILGVEYSPDRALDDAPNILRATYDGGLGEVIVDNAERISIEPERQDQVALDNIKTAQQAQTIAGRILRRLDRPILPVTVNDIAQMLEVLDVITIDSAALPEASGTYKILSIDQEIIGASMLLREYDANDYS